MELFNHLRAKTSGFLKVLLIYNCHLSYPCIRALKILDRGGVLVYYLPAHTSGRTQPLDVVLYGPFKNSLTREIKAAVQLHKTI